MAMLKHLLTLAMIIFTTASVYSDTNGIWQYAEDIVPGTFGSDEGYGPFTFNGKVSFLQPVNLKGDVDIESNLTVNGRSFFKDEIIVRGGKHYYLASGVITLPHIPSNRCPCDSNLNSWECGNKFYANGYSLPICYDVVNSEEHSSFFGLITHTIYTARVYNYHEAINVTIKDGNIKTSNITLANKLNCSKLYTDANGNVKCGIDRNNDADADPTNELQNLYSVLKRGNSAGGYRITGLHNPISASDAATKAYIDTILKEGAPPNCGVKRDGTIWKNGETYVYNEPCTYTCNCGKSGCQTCNGIRKVTFTCTYGTVSYSIGTCQ